MADALWSLQNLTFMPNIAQTLVKTHNIQQVICTILIDNYITDTSNNQYD
jgi:hypothetical protein